MVSSGEDESKKETEPSELLEEEEEVAERATKGANLRKWLECAAQLATVIIAFTAVVTSYLAVTSFNQTSQTLRAVEKGINAMTVPLIRYDRLRWVPTAVSCDTPPTGVQITYKNKSYIPLKKYRADLQLFLNGQQVPTAQVEKRSGPEILAPGEELTIKRTQKELFHKYLGKSQSLASPAVLELYLEVEYSRVGDDKHILYLMKKQVSFNCSTGETWTHAVSEDYRDI